MRIVALAAPVLFLLASGCASTPGGNRGDGDLQRLSADCTARGGILIATGAQTGKAQIDNACRITDASRFPPNN